MATTRCFSLGMTGKRKRTWRKCCVSLAGGYPRPWRYFNSKRNRDDVVDWACSDARAKPSGDSLQDSSLTDDLTDVEPLDQCGAEHKGQKPLFRASSRGLQDHIPDKVGTATPGHQEPIALCSCLHRIAMRTRGGKYARHTSGM